MLAPYEALQQAAKAMCGFDSASQGTMRFSGAALPGDIVVSFVDDESQLTVAQEPLAEAKSESGALFARSRHLREREKRRKSTVKRQQHKSQFKTSHTKSDSLYRHNVGRERMNMASIDKGLFRTSFGASPLLTPRRSEMSGPPCRAYRASRTESRRG
jgi:hypothetical protein